MLNTSMISTSTIAIEAGSINGSTFNLVAATMGAGTITMPYIISLTGIAFGSILVILGAALSHYTGTLLVSISNLKHLDPQMAQSPQK
jgi:amino acid permease